MNTVKLSDKYQVVIPKEIRKGLNLKPGQRLQISRTKSGNITITTKSVIDEIYGTFAGKKYWGDDAAVTIRKMRDEWED